MRLGFSASQTKKVVGARGVKATKKEGSRRTAGACLESLDRSHGNQSSPVELSEISYLTAASIGCRRSILSAAFPLLLLL